MIECFNILLLTDEAAFRTFTEGDLESRFTSISYQAIGHPAIVPCVLFASAFRFLYKELATSLKQKILVLYAQGLLRRCYLMRLDGLQVMVNWLSLDS